MSWHIWRMNKSAWHDRQDEMTEAQQKIADMLEDIMKALQAVTPDNTPRVATHAELYPDCRPLFLSLSLHLRLPGRACVAGGAGSW